MDTKQLLKTLCLMDGIAGDEETIVEELRPILSELGEVTTSPVSSVICDMGGEGPLVMLTAHLDKIGMVVTRVEENGFLKVGGVGGIDSRCLASMRVVVQAEGGEYLGVIGSVPPHLKSLGDKPLTVNTAYVDVGMSGEEAKAKIKLGDRVIMQNTYRELLNDQISASGMDDRAGCAAVIKAGELLKDYKKAHVVLVLSAMEEVGGVGAMTSTFSLKPDYAVAVDVTFGLTPDARPDKCVAMGKGPAVGFAPRLNRGMSKKMVDLAKEKEIPHQVEVMGGRTGTDADGIAVTAGGVKTALLSVPSLFMHSPIEVVEVCDVDNTAKLMAEFVKSL